MALHVYPNIRASGRIPERWKPKKGGTFKYPIRDPDVLIYLRSLLPGRWRKVIKEGNIGDAHYFEHQSGNVAGVKLIARERLWK
jgi:hypothetical protein